MWHGPSPKIAWNWFSPSTAKQREPPFLRQLNSSLRKYQQRGRCTMLPPTVPMLRICGVPTPSAAVTSAGYSFRAAACSARSTIFTAAPIRSPPSGGRDRLIEALDRHHAIRRDDVVLHQPEQVHAAGHRQHPCRVRRTRERRDRFLLVRRIDVGEGLQFVPPARSSSVRSLSGVIGMCRSVTPVALRIALATAAAVATAGGSPMPMTPRSG